MIVALAGRRIDELNADYVRFPLRNVQLVRERLIHKLVDINCKSIVCAGACGSDLIALDVAGELGIDRIMVLPCNSSLFKRESVVDRPGNWGILFDKIYEELLAANNVKEFDYSLNDPNTYNRTNIDILEQAKSISKDSDGLAAIIMWDGKVRGNDDVTKNFYKQAEDFRFSIFEIITSK